MARSRRESLLSDGITDQKCPQGLLQQNLPQAEIAPGQMLSDAS